MLQRFPGRRIGDRIAQLLVESLGLHVAGCNIDRNKLSTRAEQPVLRCGHKAASDPLSARGRHDPQFERSQRCGTNAGDRASVNITDRLSANLLQEDATPGFFAID